VIFFLGALIGLLLGITMLLRRVMLVRRVSFRRNPSHTSPRPLPTRLKRLLTVPAAIGARSCFNRADAVASSATMQVMGL